MTVPPHLPPPSCNISDHRKWERIKILLISVFFGLLSGITGASLMIGWLWPDLGGGNTWIFSQNYKVSPRNEIDEKVRAEFEDRIGMVYRDITNASGVDYFSQDKKIGEAIFVSSDGWLVLVHPNFDGNFKNWQVLLKNGEARTVDLALKDNYSNLVYLKISPDDQGSQYKVVNLNDEAKINEDVFVHSDGAWRHAIISNKITKSSRLPHLDTAPATTVELNQNFNVGDIVVGSQGKLVGMINNGRYTLLNQYISGALPKILSGEKVSYRTLGTFGWFSDEQPLIINNEKVSGYYVARILDNTKLKVGDLILEINGQVANSDNMWYNISGNQNQKLKVLRKNKFIEITQEVKQI